MIKSFNKDLANFTGNGKILKNFTLRQAYPLVVLEDSEKMNNKTVIIFG